MKPDISVYDEEEISPVLFAEVESGNNFPSTIRKLCFVLLTQLIYLRNIDKKKTDVYGFAVSVRKSKEDKETGGTVLANIKWKSSDLMYIANFEAIPIDKFRQEVLKIYNRQKDCLLTEIDHDCFHCFPMGNDEISNILSTEITSTLILLTH